MDPVRGNRESGSGERQLQDLEPLLQGMKGLRYHTADGVVACKRRDEEKILHIHNLIILPQLCQTDVLFRSHDQMGHQVIDKEQQRILHPFDWPVMRKSCERWVNVNCHVCG